jgi:hypothetical protein
LCSRKLYLTKFDFAGAAKSKKAAFDVIKTSLNQKRRLKNQDTVDEVTPEP